MKFKGTLDNPDLGVQYEKTPGHAYWRSFNVLRNYAQLNGFEDRLNAILQQQGVEPDKIPSGDKPPAIPPNIAARLKRGVDMAQVALKREIETGRKGPEPIRILRDYTFRLEDGRQIRFKLDPDETARDTLHDFEDILYRHASGDAIAAQFMPTFKEIRREMMRWGWDKKEASSQATLLTIKRLCDAWAVKA